MNLLKQMQIADEENRQEIYLLKLEVAELSRQLNELKRQQQPVQYIGFHAPISAMTPETAFIKWEPG